MNTNHFLLHIPLDCETAIMLVTRCLRAKELQVARTFDLQSACATLPDNVCLHHSVSPCDCQLVVLLVYGEVGNSASLVIHGNSKQAEFHLVDSPMLRAPPDLVARIRGSLSENELFEAFTQRLAELL